MIQNGSGYKKNYIARQHSPDVHGKKVKNHAGRALGESNLLRTSNSQT